MASNTDTNKTTRYYLAKERHVHPSRHEEEEEEENEWCAI